MTKVPFSFTTIPNFFFINGFMTNPKMCVFICWCFNQCHAKGRILEVGKSKKKIELQPYEFLFRRPICSRETGLSEKEIRTCILHINSHSSQEILTKRAGLRAGYF